MDITPLIPKGRQVITGYGDGGFKINQERVEGSRLVFAGQTLPWNVTRAEEIGIEHLAPVFEVLPPIEVLLIGTGSASALLNAPTRQALRDKGIAVETMDTGAACRTYNILLSEERRVAAALIAV